MSNEARQKVTEMLEAGEKLGKIEGMLLFQHDFGTNEAKELVKEVRTELGIEARPASTKLPEVVTWLRGHQELSKKEQVAGIMEAGGYTESTAAHLYNYIAMAKEWARQETEDTTS